MFTEHMILSSHIKYYIYRMYIYTVPTYCTYQLLLGVLFGCLRTCYMCVTVRMILSSHVYTRDMYTTARHSLFRGSCFGY